MSNLSTEYANDLFESIARITQSEIDKNNKFDTTEIYTITRIIEDDYDAYEIAKEIKEETTTSNIPKIKAYAQNGEKYAVGDNVYVLTPGNDSTARKAIIGKAAAAKTNEKVPYITLKDQIIIFKEGVSDITNFIPKYIVTTDGLGFFEGDFVVGSSGEFRQTINLSEEIGEEEVLPDKNEDSWRFVFDNSTLGNLTWGFSSMTGDYRYEQFKANYQEILWDKENINNFNKYTIINSNQNYSSYPCGRIEASNITHFAGLTQNTFQKEGAFIIADIEENYSTLTTDQKTKEVNLEAFWIKKDNEKNIFVKATNKDFTSEFSIKKIEPKPQVTFSSGAFAKYSLITDETTKFYKDDIYEITIPLRMFKGENIDSDLKVFLYEDSDYKKFFNGTILKTEISENLEKQQGQYQLKIRFQTAEDLTSALYLQILDFDRDIFTFTEEEANNEDISKQIVIQPLLSQISWYKYNKNSSDGWSELNPKEGNPFKLEATIDTTYDSQSFKCIIKNDKEDKDPITLEMVFSNTDRKTENKEIGLSDEVKVIGESSDYRIVTEDPDSNSNAYVKDGNYWVYGENNIVLDNANSQARYLGIVPKDKLQIYNLSWQIPYGNTMFLIDEPDKADKIYEFNNKVRVKSIIDQKDIYAIQFIFEENYDFNKEGIYHITLYSDLSKKYSMEINIDKSYQDEEANPKFIQIGLTEVPTWLENKKGKTICATVEEPQNTNNNWIITEPWEPSDTDVYYKTFTYKKKNITDLAEIKLPFTIESQYYPSRTFNQLFCEIWANETEKITISKTLQFGKQEVQGSKYRFNLIFVDNDVYKIPGNDASGTLNVKTILENDYGIQINDLKCIYKIIAPFRNTQFINYDTNKPFPDGWEGEMNQEYYIGTIVVDDNDNNSTNTVKELTIPNFLGGWKWDKTNKKMISNGEYRVLLLEVSTTTSDGITLTTYKSVPTIQTSSTFHSLSGPREVSYSASGQNPSYDLNPYALYNIDGNGNIIRKDNPGLEKTTVAVEDISNVKYNDFYKQTEDKNYYLTPPRVYLEDMNLTEDYKSIKFVKYFQDGEGDYPYFKAIIPIIFKRNLYSNTLLNDWDGTFAVNEDGNAFLANVAVGEKSAKSSQSPNTFTGVFIGKEKPKETENKRYGLFGYKEGNEIFRVTNEGEIFIGKEDSSGDNAYLNFDANSSSLDIRAKSFHVGNDNGYLEGNSSGTIRIKAHNFELSDAGGNLAISSSGTNKITIKNGTIALYGNANATLTTWKQFETYIPTQNFQYFADKSSPSSSSNTFQGQIISSESQYWVNKTFLSMKDGKTSVKYTDVLNIYPTLRFGVSTNIDASHETSSGYIKTNSLYSVLENYCSFKNAAYKQITGNTFCIGVRGQPIALTDTSVTTATAILYDTDIPSNTLILYSGCGDSFKANNDTAYILLRTLGVKTSTGGWNEASAILINSNDDLCLNSPNGRLTGSWLGTSSQSIASDINKKNTINSILTNYSILFDNLQPVTYKYNDGTSDRLHTGFIAQQVKESLDKANISTQNFAGLVIKNQGTENEEWYLRYEEFIALNTNEIQKLKKRVNQLETEVSSLKEQLFNI